MRHNVASRCALRWPSPDIECQPDIAIAELAYLLGFSEQSAFNRAFRR